MKTRIFLMMLLAVALFSCQKEKTDPVTTQDVTFQAIKIDPGAGLKNTAEWECVTNVPTHAWIVINGINYYPELFTLDGFLYTQAIKLPVGAYSISTFILFDDVNNNGVYDLGVDVIVYGTPMAISPYAIYVDFPLEYEFDVLAFQKIEIPIQVLCYKDADYDDFGFFWFNITEIVIREFCFFGDICLNGEPYLPADFTGGWYGTPPLMDEIALFYVAVLDEDLVPVANSPFYNHDPLTGALIAGPVCAKFPDNLSIDGEVFYFDIYVWTNIGGTWGYDFYGRFTVTDDGDLYFGTQVLPDDVAISFAWGTCSPDSDVWIPWLTPPVVIEGFVSGPTKKMGVRYRNFRMDGNGWDFAIGPNIPTVMTPVDWTYDADWFFSPDYNTISFVYDGTKTYTNVVVNGTTYTSYVEWLGNLGTIDYMQWLVNAAPGQTVEFYDVVLTVGPNSYPLGNFSKTASGTTWSISNFDMTGGFALTAKIKLTGPGNSDENGKVEITVKDIP